MINCIKGIFIGFVVLFNIPTSYASSWTCSSFIINDSGYIGTAGHCVKDAKQLYVQYNNVVYEAKLIAVDYDNDSAIVKINEKTPDYYRMEDPINNKDPLYVLGYPIPDMRGWGLKIKSGNILREDNGGYIVSGGTCQGNSGGPVVNSNNKLLGILVAGYGSVPCAFYIYVEKIKHIIFLAQIYDIPLNISVVPSVKIYTKEEILDQNKNKTPVLMGISNNI